MGNESLGEAWWRTDRAKRVWFAAFLVYLIYPTIGFLEEDHTLGDIGTTLGGLLVFIALYLRVMWRAVGRFGENRTPVALVALILVSFVLAFELPHDWLIAHPYYLLACLTVSLPPRGYLMGAALVIVSQPLLGWAVGVPFAEALTLAAQATVIAAAIHIFSFLAQTVAELQEAREEVARLAVESERLRFARDLHDTLGHALSAIVVKSELAGKLARRDLDRTSTEISDIERVARRALQDMRDTVTGYRSPDLDEEIDGALQMLKAAGITGTVEGTGLPRPPCGGALLAWAIREATTNVIRHSRATRCSIVLRGGPTVHELEVTDDGVGAAAVTDGSAEGNGLVGLAERVADVGGTLDAGPADTGGFRVLVRVPADGKA